MRSQKPLIEKTLKLFFSIRTIAQLNCDQSVIVSMLDLQLKGSKFKPHLVTNDCQCQSQNYRIIPYLVRLSPIDYFVKRKEKRNAQLRTEQTNQRTLHPCLILGK